jgi:hypothetical protein
MDKELKLRLADMVIDFLSMHTNDKKTTPKNIGTLTKVQGQNGFKRAEIGTPVFDLGDRYMIMLESLDGKRNVEMTYYKEILAPVIEFTDAVEKLKHSFGTVKSDVILTSEDLRRENMYGDNGR